MWQDVKVYHANQQMFEVTDVVVNDTATMLTMTAKGKPDTQFLIRRSSHLRDDRGRYYGLQSWDGIDVGRSVGCWASVKADRWMWRGISIGRSVICSRVRIALAVGR